jgi:lysophospholipase L1-like esterase
MRYLLCSVLLISICIGPLVIHADASIKVLPLGDSITRGGDLSSSPYPSYRFYLYQSLTASGYSVDLVGSTSSSFSQFSFDQQHDGHSGYTTGKMVGTSSSSPLKTWLSKIQPPDIVLLHVGTNDVIQQVPLETRKANIKKIVALLREKNPKVRILIAQIIPTGDTFRNVNSGLISFNQALPGLAAELSTSASPVSVVDQYSGYDGTADNQGDGIHPKTPGEKKIADRWHAALKPILSGMSATSTPTKTPTATKTKTPIPTPTPAPWALHQVPCVIEAENYAAGGEGVGYHDTTSGNSGGAYRSDDVDISKLSDGRYVVTGTANGEWLMYSLRVATPGIYELNFTAASSTGTAAIQVQIDGATWAQFSAPKTGSLSQFSHERRLVYLPVGDHSMTLRLSGGLALDAIRCTIKTAFPTPATTTVTKTPTPSPTKTVTGTPTPTTTPTLEGSAVPGQIQAENYDGGGEGTGYHDTTDGNSGGYYRGDGVDITKVNGAYVITNIAEGEWLRYTIAVPTGGSYRLALRYASWSPGCQMKVFIDGDHAGTVQLSKTGSDIGFGTADGTFTLTPGSHKLTLKFIGTGQRLDWFEFVKTTATTATTTTATTKTTAFTTKTTAITTCPTQSGGIPGTIEAEDYDRGSEGVAYHDTTAGNLGGAYRNDDVDIETLVGGGYGISHVKNGEWLRYTLPVSTTGRFRATFHVSSWGTATHSIKILVDDSEAVTVPIPNTGAYNAWTTASADLSLTSGTRKIKLLFAGDGQNLDRVVFSPVVTTSIPTTVPTTVVTTTIPTTTKPTTTATPTATPSGRPVPGTIEAEDYDIGGEGIGYHDTTAGNHDNVYRYDDVDLSVNPSGGYNIGYVVDGEWLAYTLKVPSAGTYTISCSVAAWADGRSITLLRNGASLATLAVPNNKCVGWKTISSQVQLPAGANRLVFRFGGDKQILDRIIVSAGVTPTMTAPTTVPTTTRPTTITPTPTATPIGGTILIPARVQAEDYLEGGDGVGYHDTTPGNQGGAYRQDGVDIVYSAPISSYIVTQIRSGEWLEYSIEAPVERDYALSFQVSSAVGGQYFEMKVDNRSEVTVMVPRTGSADTFTTISTSVRLTKGTHRVRIVFYGDGQNLDSFNLA